jgi:hypothetical protein
MLSSLNSWRRRADFLTWFWIVVLSLSAFSLRAQSPDLSQGTFEHSNGLWLGWQRSNPGQAEQSFFLTDNGSILLNRGDEGQNDAKSLTWNLGLGRSLDRFIIVQGQSAWQRTAGRHRFTLGLDGGGSVFWRAIRFAALEEQFLLTSGVGFAATEGRIDRLGAGIQVSDSIAVTRNLDVLLDASHRESQTSVDGQTQNRSKIDSWGSSLSQRWTRGGLQASIQRSELELQNSPPAAELFAEQSVLDIQARMIFPLFGRINGSIGWQDLSSTATGVSKQRQAGPELGLNYPPFSAWSGSLLLRALNASGAEANEAQIFGEANIAWRSDAANNFTLAISKQLDLLASFRAFTVENLVASDQQLSTVSQQIRWQHQRGRYTLSLSLLENRQQFAQSVADFTEVIFNQILSVTRRAEINVGITSRQSQFKTDTPPIRTERVVTDIQLGWQEVLAGGSRPFGGRNFYRFDVSYENLQERIINLRAERLTFLASFGHRGNF